MNAYRQRVWTQLYPLLTATGQLESVLDFGCGDGWFATQWLNSGLCSKLTPLDVKRRNNVQVEPVIYEANQAIPFPDKSFDLVYTIDVLHHCGDPFFQLNELMRVSKRYLLIKDHTYSSIVGYITLAVLDELGNKKFGIPSPYHYQKNWSWSEHLGRQGWFEQQKIHPALCHKGLLGCLTNRLQYISLYEFGGSCPEKLQAR